MRFLYSLAWLLVLPFAFLYLLWRARRQPEYLRYWEERLGWVRPWAGGRRIWIHAVSVGETRAAAPLIAAWRARHPDCAILLTHATPTGRETGASLFGETIEQAYLPYDFPVFVWLFLKRAQPDLGVIMNTSTKAPRSGSYLPSSSRNTTWQRQSSRTTLRCPWISGTKQCADPPRQRLRRRL